MNRPSDVEKLSSDKRLAWRALSTLGTQLLLHGSRPFCGGGPVGSRHARRHGHGLHSKRPHAYQGAHGCVRNAF